MPDTLVNDPDADQRMVRTSVPAYLPQVLLYPLRGHCPPVILLGAVFIGFGSLSLLAIVALIVGLSLVTHYAIRILENTSQGHARPPMLTIEAIQLSDGFTWSALAAPAALLALSANGQDGIALLLALFVPAHWIALATTRSFVAACNPLRWLHILWVTAPSYGLACAFALGAHALGHWAQSELSSFLVIGVWLYLLFAGCHLLGFVAYHRHERLGVGVQIERPTEERARFAEQSERLDTLIQGIERCLSQRDPEGAAKLLFETPPGPADARLFHEELYDRLKTRRFAGLALAQAARLITCLLEKRLLARAAEVLENAFDLDARFRPEQARELSALAAYAIDHGPPGLRDRIFQCRSRHFADDPAAEPIDVIQLRDLIELRKDREAARKVLEKLGDFSTRDDANTIRIYARELGMADPG